MIRGDSESITVRRTDTPFEVGDIVTFTVRKNVNADIALQKIVSEFDEEGKAVIPIFPSDTHELEFGRYKYDIQLTFTDGTVVTLYEPQDFMLLKECTY